MIILKPPVRKRGGGDPERASHLTRWARLVGLGSWDLKPGMSLRCYLPLSTDSHKKQKKY